MWLIVHMKPVDSSSTSLLRATCDELFSDSLPLPMGSNCGIQYKTVATAIGDNFNESDQFISVKSTDIKMAVANKGWRIDWSMVRPCTVQERVQGLAGDGRRNS